MSNRILLALGLSAALLLGACSSDSGSPTTSSSTVAGGSTTSSRPTGSRTPSSERFTVDGDETLTVAAGTTFEIALDANMTTGYRWTAAVTGSSVRETGSDYEAPDTDRDGAGGTQVFTFQAESAGTSTIELTYAQEGSDDVGEQYTVTVDVT